MRVDLQGQVALLFGGDTAVGSEVARRLSESGAQLASGSARQAQERFGRLDMVVNCAPLAPAEGGAVAELADELPGFAAAANVLRDAAATMRAQGSGRIVTAIGIGATVVRRDEGAVSAAMAAIASLTRTAALELGRHGVLVNAVAAGPGESALGYVPLGYVPVGCLPSPAAIANAILFLLAPAASYVTGHVLVVDGGFSAGYVRNF